MHYSQKQPLPPAKENTVGTNAHLSICFTCRCGCSASFRDDRAMPFGTEGQLRIEEWARVWLAEHIDCLEDTQPKLDKVTR